MQLLPDLENNRPLAIGLLVIALVLVYFIFFHWFVARHLEMAGQVSQLEESAARFKAAVERRQPLERRLEELRAERLDSALFLPSTSANQAAAALSRLLRNLIDQEAEDAELCTIASVQNQPDRDPERFEQVTVNVRMNCPLPDFARILYELENSIPLVFVDNLNIQQTQSVEQAGRRRSRTPYGQVDVQFSMFGFLPQQLETDA